ncbi:DUF2334 domain-containing protein [Candidatus Woesearchaeota archaeon]|nr:DUF2334 domain-containing protein [Candidatus Woesearchaeota archaeon]HIH54635.1 DUF2334 domain-containing protein [Candidatus Woesearchaeota archaeon]HIJ02312.1 DUF2334 domain-containing protein [Candidatus Woesearchaeota archaeon]
MKQISDIIYPQEFAFFRDDDIGLENEKFIDFSESFLSDSIPLNIAVIPNQITYMTDKFKRYLSKDIFTIFQHGNTHRVNYTSAISDSDIYKSMTPIIPKNLIIGEFHTSLKDNFSEQNLIKGWKLIELHLKTKFKGFIPPWHSFPEIKLLLDNNYEIISGYGNKIEIIKNKTISIPTNLDIIKDYSKNECYDLRSVLNRSEILLKDTRYVGILLHHNFMTKDSHKLIAQIAEHSNKNNIPIISLEEALKWKIK